MNANRSSLNGFSSGTCMGIRPDARVTKVKSAISRLNGMAMQARCEENLITLCTLWSRVGPTDQRQSTPKQMMFECRPGQSALLTVPISAGVGRPQRQRTPGAGGIQRKAGLSFRVSTQLRQLHCHLLDRSGELVVAFGIVFGHRSGLVHAYIGSFVG